MKKIPAILTIGSLLLFTFTASHAQARESDDKQVVDGKQSKAIEAPAPENPWEAKLAMPMWLAGISGDVGVHGFNTHVDTSFSQILKHLNSTASFAGELRKGRFGAYADFLYMNLSESTAANSPVLAGGSVRIQEYLADFDVSYRIVEGPRGWVDALAGVRYLSISQQLNLYPNFARINQASTDLVNTIASNAATSIKAAVSAALDGKLDALKDNVSQLPAGPLAAPQQAAMEAQVAQILQSSQGNLAAAIASGIQARINAVKAGISQQITNALSSAIATPRNQTNDWADPYVGFRARLNMYKEVLYLTTKTDIGGFDAGSKISAEAYGALGCQITRNIYAEAGYKYLYEDYDSGGFLYKTATQGAQITTGWKF